MGYPEMDTFWNNTRTG